MNWLDLNSAPEGEEVLVCARKYEEYSGETQGFKIHTATVDLDGNPHLYGISGSYEILGWHPMPSMLQLKEDYEKRASDLTKVFRLSQISFLRNKFIRMDGRLRFRSIIDRDEFEHEVRLFQKARIFECIGGETYGLTPFGAHFVKKLRTSSHVKWRKNDLIKDIHSGVVEWAESGNKPLWRYYQKLFGATPSDERQEPEDYADINMEQFSIDTLEALLREVKFQNNQN